MMGKTLLECSAEMEREVWRVNEGFNQLRAEHVSLLNELEALYRKTKYIGIDKRIVNWSIVLSDLRTETEQFIRHLNDHLQWEEEVFFPLVLSYANIENLGIAHLKEDHRMASERLNEFLRLTNGLQVPLSREEARAVAACQLQAIAILTEHINDEEKNLVPIAEAILTDMELFFS